MLRGPNISSREMNHQKVLRHANKMILCRPSTPEGVTWAKNGLRHSYISYQLAILNDTARVALEAGNSPDVIFAHYRELVTPEAAKAWFADTSA